MILQPRLLVLDEPTSALDVSIQQQILRLLGDLQKRHRLSYVFISHDLTVVSAMAHRILVMKDGAVVEEGETVQLISRPTHSYTRQLFEAAKLA